MPPARYSATPARNDWEWRRYSFWPKQCGRWDVAFWLRCRALKSPGKVLSARDVPRFNDGRPQSNATSLPVPILTRSADSGEAGFSFVLAGRGMRLTVPFKPMLL